MDQERKVRLTAEAEAEARRQILQCIYRYARGIDRHDAEITRSAYHDDAIDDHGFFIGPAHEFAERANETHAALAAHQHYILNHLVEFDDETTASVETYWIMGARRRADNTGRIGGGRYLDRFELRDGRWAIAERVCVTEWSLDGEQAAFLAQFYMQGAQDRTDPSYRRPFRGGRPQRNITPDGYKPR